MTFIVSHERSGSHLLEEMIRTFHGVHVFDEVCNPRAMAPDRDPAYFHAFKYDWITRNRSIGLVPTYENNRRMMLAYVEHVAALSSGRPSVVDVKYGHLHNFEAAWWPALYPPALFEFARSGGARVLHLYREDVVAATISAHVAELRRIWHLRSDDDDEVIRQAHVLDAQAVAADAVLLRKQVDLVREHSRRSSVALELTYRELVEAVATDAHELMVKLAQVVGGSPPDAFTPQQRKLIPSISAAVENVDEVRAACEAAGLDAGSAA